jgi:hypothetical protein
MSQSSYNEQEVADQDARLKVIENLLGINATGYVAPSFAALKVLCQAMQNGRFDVVTAGNIETSTTDAGALSISKLLSNISSAAGESRTLAAPAADGVLKLIVMTVKGGNVTLAATNIGAGTGTATFDAVGKSLVLISAGGKWHKVGGTAVIA